MFMVDAVRFPEQATWDPIKRGVGFTPSNNDLTMTLSGAGSWTSCKAYPHKSSGKWYAEIVATTTPNTTGHIYGITNDAHYMQTYLGGADKTVGFRAGGSSKFVSGSGVASSWATTLTVVEGDTVMLAMDVDAGKCWIGVNGTWLGSGDPVAGTNAAATFGAGNWTFAASGLLPAAFVFTLRPSGFNYSPPSGYSAVGDTPRYRLYVIVDGDSITAGTNGPTTPYAVTALTGIALNPRLDMQAAGGSQISAMETRATYYDKYALNRSDKKSVVSIMCGRNDIAVGGRTAAQVITSLQTYGAARKAAGHHVVMCTILPDSSSGFNATRATINTAMRTWGGTYWDSLVDYDTTLMGLDATASDTLYYADGTHPTQLGEDLLSVLFRSVIEAI